MTNLSTSCALRGVVLVHRHGARAPVIQIPGLQLPNNVKCGHLTDIGRDQIRQLGRNVYQRYRKFLNSGAQIEAYTSVSPRCQESARLFYDSFPDSIRPSEVVPTRINMKITCEDLSAHSDKTVAPHPYKTQYGETIQSLVSALATQSNSPYDTFQENMNLIDAFYCARGNGWQMPEWMKQHPKELTRVEKLLYDEFMRGSKFLLAMEVLEKIVAMVENENEPPKFVTFSLHDVNIAALEQLLELPTGGTWPQFADTLCFEYYTGSEGSIRILRVGVTPLDQKFFVQSCDRSVKFSENSESDFETERQTTVVNVTEVKTVYAVQNT